MKVTLNWHWKEHWSCNLWHCKPKTIIFNGGGLNPRNSAHVPKQTSCSWIERDSPIWTVTASKEKMWCLNSAKNVKVAHTRLPNVGFRSWCRFFAVNLQVTWVINPAVSCHYFPPCLQLPPQPLRGLLPISLLGEQRHDVHLTHLSLSGGTITDSIRCSLATSDSPMWLSVYT